MKWIVFCTIIYIIVIIAMCWSSAESMHRSSDNKIKDFIRKNIKRYK